LDTVDEVLTTAAGRRVGVLQRGSSAGVPVLYLHGMPGGRGEQRYFPDDAVARANLRIISIDRPGWGRTDPLPGDRPTRVRDALDVCDVLGIERFVAMGLSTGGSYALTLAAVAPDRVDRVILACGQMPYDDDDAIAGLIPGQRALIPMLRGGRTPLLEQGLEEYRATVLDDALAALEQQLHGLSPAERALLAEPWFLEAMVQEMRDGIGAGIEGAIDDLLAWPVPLEVDPAEVRCPVLAVHGTEDDSEPITNLRRILAEVPRAQVFAVEGCGHLAPMLYPHLTLSLAAGH
jgi:pimeloyl-ACP methyl ester carboxylesterase